MEQDPKQLQSSDNFHQLIKNLALYELLDPFCKKQAESAYVESHNIKQDIHELSSDEAIDALRQDLGTQDINQFQEWIRSHALTDEKDLISHAQSKQRRKAVINDLLKGWENLYSSVTRIGLIGFFIA